MEFLKDMALVIQGNEGFSRQEPERIRIPKLKEFEVILIRIKKQYVRDVSVRNKL